MTSYAKTPVKHIYAVIFADENSVSFKMFLIMLSFMALGSESSEISVFKHCRSNTQISFLFLFITQLELGCIILRRYLGNL